jgi:hypothetical protein
LAPGLLGSILHLVFHHRPAHRLAWQARSSRPFHAACRCGSMSSARFCPLLTLFSLDLHILPIPQSFPSHPPHTSLHAVIIVSHPPSPLLDNNLIILERGFDKFSICGRAWQHWTPSPISAPGPHCIDSLRWVDCHNFHPAQLPDQCLRLTNCCNTPNHPVFKSRPFSEWHVQDFPCVLCV